jgi:hypothetical protein
MAARMAPTHDGARLLEHRAPRWLVRLANATALYPLFLLGSLFGQCIIGLWIGTLRFLRADPWRVVEWWVDGTCSVDRARPDAVACS